MATFTATANSTTTIGYAQYGSTTWNRGTSNGACQGAYQNTSASGSRVGVMVFFGAGAALVGKIITGITLKITSSSAGSGSSSKKLSFRKANYQTLQTGIKGSAQVGDALGTLTGTFYGNTATHTLNASTNSALFEAMGCISPSANYAASLSAEYTGNALSAGDTLNKADVTVTVAFHDGTTAQTTDFTIDAPYTISAGENTFAVRYGTVSGTLTVTAAATGAQTLLLEHVTQYAGTDERDRVWFGRHMEAGTYNLHITLSDTLGSNASGGDALILKTASAYGDSAGTQLFNVSITNAMGKTGFTGTITLPEATDGFFLYAKMFKVGVTISAYVDGAVSNTTLMDLTTIGTLQGSAASPGAAWFPVTLSAKAYYYKLSVGGSSPTAVPAVLCQTAASDGDTAGTALFSYDGSACTGGATMEGSFTLTEAISFIYISFTPGSKSTFEVTLSVI